MSSRTLIGERTTIPRTSFAENTIATASSGSTTRVSTGKNPHKNRLPSATEPYRDTGIRTRASTPKRRSDSRYVLFIRPKYSFYKMPLNCCTGTLANSKELVMEEKERAVDLVKVERKSSESSICTEMYDSGSQEFSMKTVWTTSSNHSLYPALLLWVSYPGTGHGSDLHRNIFHHFASPFNTWRMHKFGRFALNFVRDYDHTSAHIFPLRHIENRPRLRSLDVCGIAQGI
mmetsp:Transcript_743/g.1700  ORF Transcript_743/g.1700 Transcript_743/m.1700 type:complete len:231 (+) Transcript_743:443-1135(+)